MNDNTTKIEKELSDNDKLKMSLRVYLRFWSFIVKRQLVSFIGYAIFLVAMASLTPIFTFLWKQYIDTATAGENVSFAFLILFLYIVIKIILDFCYFFSMRFMDNINFSSWRVLDIAINKKAANIHGELFEIPNVQNKINRAWEFNHGSYIQLYQLGLDSVRYITQTIGIFLSIYIISPMICGIALITVIPTIISKLVGDKISVLNKRELTDDENELGYYRNAIYDQSLIKEITIKNAFDFFQRKYKTKAAEIFKKRRIIELKKSKLLIFEESFRNIAILICLLFASYQLINGAISLGGLAAVFTIIINLIYTLSNLVQNGCSVFTLTYNIRQFYEFMDLGSNSSKVQMFNPDLDNEKNSINFNNVSYRYPLTNKYVLRNVNVSIKKGEHIAIVGANGSGKSTFVKLVLKLLEPSTGEIKYNNVNLSIVDCSEYWGLFSTVFQDYSKFKDSLRYNVSISNIADNMNDKKIKEVLLASEFNKNVDLDCMLSKEFGGIELSGGEWQKIALARSIFKSSNIYILDEPTSAIDPIKESELYKRFAEITKGKTSIFVTHRLGSVLYSDLVLFFKDGEIVEVGTHDELLSKKGLYFQFWNTQLSLYNI
jgi:ABC-type multidrug transport system fused ATPase/permease subunit